MIKNIKNAELPDWNIPDNYPFDDFPLKLSKDQLQILVLEVWKQYMLHDEVISAIQFLESAPYVVRDTFLTEKALTVTKESIAWIDNLNLIQINNSPENVLVEAGTPMPFDLSPHSQENNRFRLILDNLGPAPKSLIDLGCMDGGFTNRYGMSGYDVTGIDLSETSVRLANQKAVEFNTNAKHYVSMFKDIDKLNLSKKFDYVTSSDTYEHIINRVEDMLIPMKFLLKDGGKFLLVTPHGAWMRGEYLDWAHPWVWEKINGTGWLDPNPRFHLIAPSVWSVADDFREAGYRVENCRVALCSEIKDVEGQGNIFCESIVNVKKLNKILDIVFYLGKLSGTEQYPDINEKAIKLARLGHTVKIFTNITAEKECISNFVEYHQSNKIENVNCDVLFFDDAVFGKSKQSVSYNSSGYTNVIDIIVNMSDK